MADAVFYTTLEGEGEAEFTEKRSVFIGHARPVESEEEAQAYIKKQKSAYMDARHNVWAYMMQGEIVARYSDDGEPQGTAGVPVLDTIRKSGVTDAVVVVTRYFGGILLGAGGLVRAYSHTAKLALEAAHIITYEQYTELELVCTYSDYQRYQAELPRFGAVVDDTQFTDRVTLLFAVKSTVVDDLTRRVREMSGGKDAPTVRGTRFDYR
ncbi:MAG: YigZ family protein [Ruminococcaceae bacterium]|nr:YigZ family protein [Oscillospiraceae bacterium]